MRSSFFNGKNLGSDNKNEMVQTGDPLLVKMRKIKENCFMMNNEGRHSDKTWTTVTGKKGRINTNFEKLEEKKMLEAINNELLYNNGENLPIFTENWQKGAHRKSEKKSSKTNNNYTGNVDDSIVVIGVSTSIAIFIATSFLTISFNLFVVLLPLLRLPVELL